MIFEGTAYIGHGSKLSVNTVGVLRLGNNFEISAESSIIVYKEVEFGHCLLSWDVLVMDSDVHSIRNSQRVKINPSKPVRIADKVWNGARCTVLKGTEIPSGAVIASGTLVSKKLTGENKIFGGNPVKELKSDIYWER